MIIDNVHLSRLSISGTHDHGTFKMDEPVTSALTRTQEQTLANKWSMELDFSILEEEPQKIIKLYRIMGLNIYL